MIASDEWAAANGKEVLAEVVAHAQSANDFPYLATTPASSAMKALDKAGLQPGDIDLWEINEAFAAMVLSTLHHLPQVDREIVNVNGGAIAIGHPLGASAPRVLVDLCRELRRRGGGYGVASICIGVGQGLAVVLEA